MSRFKRIVGARTAVWCARTRISLAQLEAAFDSLPPELELPELDEPPESPPLLDPPPESPLDFFAAGLW